MIKLVMAKSRNYIIGVDGVLPWHMPDDLKMYKEYTGDNIVIMGHNTFKSLKGTPAFNRHKYMWVVHKIENDRVYYEFYFQGMLQTDCPKVGMHIDAVKELEPVVIGGSKIYSMFYPYVNEMQISLINHNIYHKLGQKITNCPEELEEINLDKWQAKKQTTIAFEYDLNRNDVAMITTLYQRK